MKYPFALTALLLSLPLGAAWISRVGQTHSARTANAAAGQHHHPLTTLQSLMTPPAESSSSSSSSPSGRSREEINAELASGKLMEGGKVMDFSSVKGLSRAEQALADARQQTPTAATAAIAAEHVVSKDAILGINQDVINLVGHELATFATPREVQECAAYLRYKAPQALFNDQNDGAVQTFYSVEQKERFQALLARAYAESGEVTSAFAKTFYMGTMLLPPAAQKAIWAVYVWCRRTDEIVDAPRENDQDMLVDLGEWERRLENLWKNGDAQDVYDLCLLDCLVEYPNMDITPFMDMIRGMLMDVPGLGQDRYDSFDELHLYCYRVAGTVGLMSLPIFGCATGYTDEIARYV
jgi:phytoene synthase